MSTYATRTSGCSGSLLMPSFAKKNGDFGTCCRTPAWSSATHTGCVASLLRRMTIFKQFLRGFRTTQRSQLAELDAEHCTHPVLAETLAPGKPANIAVSIALMSMLHTSGDFNVLQMLVDSEKFDLSEPLLFHMPLKYRPHNSWSLVAVDPIEVALLIERGSDFDDPKSFRLHLNSNAYTPPAYCYRRKDHYGHIYSSTFLEVLIEMFDMHFWNSRHENKVLCK